MTVARPLTGYQSLVEKSALDISVPLSCALALDWISQCAIGMTRPGPPVIRVGAKAVAAYTAGAATSASAAAESRTFCASVSMTDSPDRLHELPRVQTARPC